MRLLKRFKKEVEAAFKICHGRKLSRNEVMSEISPIYTSKEAEYAIRKVFGGQVTVKAKYVCNKSIYMYIHI